MQSPFSNKETGATKEVGDEDEEKGEEDIGIREVTNSELDYVAVVLTHRCKKRHIPY